MRYHLGAAFAVALAASVTPAIVTPVMAAVEVGQLDCRGASQQFIVGSITNLQCLFRPSSGAVRRPMTHRSGASASTSATISPPRSSGRCSRRTMSRPGSAERHLCWRVRQRDGRRRHRRQRAVGRLQQHHRAAAAERAGPDRPRRCRRHLGDGDAARPNRRVAVIVTAADRIQRFDCVSRRRASMRGGAFILTCLACLPGRCASASEERASLEWRTSDATQDAAVRTGRHCHALCRNGLSAWLSPLCCRSVPARSPRTISSSRSARRGVGETFVPELGQNAGIFKKHGLALDIFYTQGGGETIQVVISNAAHIGVAIGFLGTIGAYRQGRAGARHRLDLHRRQAIVLVCARRFADQVAARTPPARPWPIRPTAPRPTPRCWR